MRKAKETFCFFCLAIMLIATVRRLRFAPAKKWGSPDKPLVITFVPSGDTGKITKAGTRHC